MGWKTVKVEKGVLQVIRGFLTYAFKNILFPECFPPGIDKPLSIHLHFGDPTKDGIQIMSSPDDKEGELSIFT